MRTLSQLAGTSGFQSQDSESVTLFSYSPSLTLGKFPFAFVVLSGAPRASPQQAGAEPWNHSSCPGKFLFFPFLFFWKEGFPE